MQKKHLRLIQGTAPPPQPAATPPVGLLEFKPTPGAVSPNFPKWPPAVLTLIPPKKK